MRRVRNTLIFVHVPKTGGTTFTWAVLPAAFPADEIRQVPGTRGENERAIRELLEAPIERVSGLRVVAGHNTRDVADAVPGSEILTLLRDPRRHLPSMYRHQLRIQRERVAAGDAARLEREPTFEEFVVGGAGELWLPGVRTRLPNPQLGALARDGEDAAAALAAVAALGLTENLIEFLFSLRIRYGFPLVLFHDRMVHGGGDAAKGSAREDELIRHHHAADVDLHVRARERVRAESDVLFGKAERALLERYREALARFRKEHPGEPLRTALFDDVGASFRSHLATGQPRVSIVTPCFQGAAYLRGCIESVLTQDYPNLEHVIQDGASTDGTLEILREYGDRIDWVSEPDRGEPDGLDRAIARCRGDVILVLNSDDMLQPGAVWWGVEQLANNPNVAVIYGDQYLVNAHDEIIGAVAGPDPWSYEELVCVEQVPPAQAAFIRRSHFHSVGLRADSALATCPDHEMWVRIGRRHPMMHVAYFVTKYRWHTEGTGRRRDGIDQMVRDKRAVNERVFDDPDTGEELAGLRRRATASLDLWAASMCSDSGDTLGAIRYAARAILARPTSDNLAWALRGFRNWLRWRAHGARWDGA